MDSVKTERDNKGMIRYRAKIRFRRGRSGKSKVPCLNSK